MDFTLWAALAGLLVFLVSMACLPLRRRDVIGTSRHAEASHFTLKEGHMIVGVLEEDKTLCFDVGRNRIEKDYE